VEIQGKQSAASGILRRTGTGRFDKPVMRLVGDEAKVLKLGAGGQYKEKKEYEY
jgi:hypothetical protein